MNYHFVRQREETDCGFACLAMIIEHFHRHQVSLFSLKNQAYNFLKTQGLSFFNLIELAQKYQLAGEGYKCTSEMLLQNAHRCPMIAQVKNQNGNRHYVILDKISEKQLIIVDPGGETKFKKISWNFFQEIFLEHILLFKKVGKLATAYHFSTIIDWLQNTWWTITMVVLLNIGINFLWLQSVNFINIFEGWINNLHIDWWEFSKFVLTISAASCLELVDHWFLQRYFTASYQKILITFLQQTNSLQKVTERFCPEMLEIITALIRLFTNLWQFCVRLGIFVVFSPLIFLWLGKMNCVFIFLPLIASCIIALFKIYLVNYYHWKKPELDFKKRTFEQNLEFYLVKHTELHKTLVSDHFQKQILQAGHHWQKIDNHLGFFVRTNQIFNKLVQKIFYFSIFLFLYWSIASARLNYVDLVYLTTLSMFYLSIINEMFSILLTIVQNNGDFQYLEWLKSATTAQLKIFTKLKTFQIQELMLISNQNLQIVNSPPIACGHYCLQDTIWTSLLFDKIYEQNSAIIFNDKQIGASTNLKIFYYSQEYEIFKTALVNQIFSFNPEVNYKQHQTNELLVWLEKYNLQLEMMIDPHQLSLAQQQLITFWTIFFSEAQVYLLNGVIEALQIEDQTKLWELFLKNKPDCFVIIATNRTLTIPLVPPLPVVFKK